MKQAKRLTVWLIVNSVFAYMVWAGFIAGVEGAQYVVKFFVWAVCLPIGFISAASSEVQRALGPEPSSPIRRAISRVVSWGTLGVLVWTGHVATGVAWGLFLVLAAIALQGARKLRDDAAKAESA